MRCPLQFRGVLGILLLFPSCLSTLFSVRYRSLENFKVHVTMSFIFEHYLNKITFFWYDWPSPSNRFGQESVLVSDIQSGNEQVKINQFYKKIVK